jgi:nanoRNase/pAp phosphatase (c-di-AMP/oligoRNAs hydrolase)
MSTKAKMPAKAKPRPKVPDYCDVEPLRDDSGNDIWPAPQKAMDEARAFIKEAAASSKKVLIVPDKDADGLSSGVILYRTLVALGLDQKLIDVHLVQKGSGIHEDNERLAMTDKKPGFVIVLDQGSRPGPPVTEDDAAKALIIDHHLSDSFPERAQVVSACHFPPVSTSSLLTYEICKILEPSIADSCAYLACIGTHGDLGNTLKWQYPFPDMTQTLKTYTKKAINDAVSLVNAPRRTAKYDVITAWEALLASTDPKDLLKNGRLQSARFEINEEVEMNTHTPPKFSQDGRIAVLRINSKAQVHPVIATRWAGYLNSKALEIVMCANFGYLPGMVNFSCRIARCARNQDPPVNIIDSLKVAADLSTDGLRDRMGESFARGHKEASGGIVPVEAFEELMSLLRVGEKPEKKDDDQPKTKKPKTIDKSPQKNTLGNYFKKSWAPRDGNLNV